MELTEKGHAGGFVLSLANGGLSLENITIASGQDLEAGTVLGKITLSGLYTQLDPGASTGEQSAAGILFAAVDASDGQVDGVAVVRVAEVNQHELIWPDDISTGEKDTAIAQLKALFVVPR